MILAILRLFTITSLGLYDLKILSNGHIMARELSKWGAIIPNRIDKAVREVAGEFVRDCVKSIDDMIYSQPEGSTGYKRTKTLRKSHTIKRLGEGVYLVSNSASYAVYQHDGWSDKSGGWHPGRPWMDMALENNQGKYMDMMDEAVVGMWG